VPTFGRVLYKGVYKGIDQVFYGNEKDLEYDFIVSPGADPGVISVALEGHEKIAIDAAGNIQLQLKSGRSILMKRPYAYQVFNSTRRQVPADYVLTSKGEVKFRLGSFDKRRQLIIDPVLSYSTYLGEAGSDTAFGISTDSSGNAYIVGSTDTVETGESDNTNVLITKLNPQGTQRIYSHILGGSGDETGFDIKTGADGSVYVTGGTSSPDFPVVNAAQPSFGQGFQDCFIAKLNPEGTDLSYSTFLGGTGDDACFGIDLDADGNAYVTGSTDSTELSLIPGSNAFVAKYNAFGNDQIYLSILGGDGDDIGYSVAAGSDGSAYVVGATDSENFQTEQPFQPALGGTQDAFIAKLNPEGSATIFSTYLGGSEVDAAFDIAVDNVGNAYIVGSTNSPEFSSLEGSNVFAAKFTADGSERTYFAIIGGNGDDVAFSVALDSEKCVYITGATSSTNFTTAEPLQASLAGSQDAFVAKLNAAGNSLIYSTYLGGTGNDAGFGIAVSPLGSAFVAGFTSSEDFVLQDPFQSVLGGGADAFVARLVAAAGPETAIVGGQVLTSSGQGVRSAVVTITDSQGIRRSTLTSNLGFYSFDEVVVGQQYVVSVSSRRYRFASLPILVNDNLTNLNFVGLE
jgi:hypothetical protein